MQTYIKKPIPITAIKWDATAITFEEIKKTGVDWEPGEMGSETFLIKTMEGKMLCRKGDYMIKGIKGEFYPHEGELFERVYQSTDNGTILWFDIAKGELPLKDEKDETISREVLVFHQEYRTCIGIYLFKSKQWFYYSGAKFTPTHFAYVNNPE